MESAQRREVLLTSTAHDAAAGCGIRFSDAGAYELKGFATPYRLDRAA
jgi:hypothetical protein